jgi:hypothetical protein
MLGHKDYLSWCDGTARERSQDADGKTQQGI